MPLDTAYGIFYEKQSGGLCRMHALNAFFGYGKITPPSFQEWVITYDKYIKKRFNTTTSGGLFDLINSDQTNLVSFILKKNNIHARYYALNTLYNKPLDNIVCNAQFIFVYNFGHIWGIKKLNGRHYKVDSIVGVHPFDLNNIKNTRDIGILVPVSLKYEWENKIDEINTIMDREGIKCKRDLSRYLTNLHSNNEILKDLEIPLGVAMSILETNLQDIHTSKFIHIRELVNTYNEFLAQFSNGQYNNLGLILDYIPDIVFVLLNFQ